VKNKKLIIAAAVIIAVLAVLVTIFAVSPETFYGTSEDSTSSETVTIEIDAHTIFDNYDKLDKTLQDERYVPADGVILPETTIAIEDGDTVFDVLLKATTENEIQIEYSALSNSAYVEGINYLYEFSCGDLSGWMYSVNGDFAQTSCDSYILSDGDEIKWIYTCDLGRDIGGGFEE